MTREPPFNEFPWLWTSQRRRLTIGDSMVGVALAALACLLVTVTLRSSLSEGERSVFGVLVLVLFGLLAAQWKLASVPVGALESARSTLLGILSYLVGMTTFVVLLLLASAFAEGAVLVVVAMLVSIVYLTTWD